MFMSNLPNYPKFIEASWVHKPTDPVAFTCTLYHCSICSTAYTDLQEHCKESGDNEHIVMSVHGS